MAVRGRWKYDEKTNSWIDYVPQEPSRVHAIITDEMQPLQHMANGKFYTSKSEFRRVTKAFGFEEIGNEVNWRAEKPVDPNYDDKLEETVTRSYFDVRDGNAQLSELDKKLCREADEKLEQLGVSTKI